MFLMLSMYFAVVLLLSDAFSWKIMIASLGGIQNLNLESNNRFVVYLSFSEC